MASNSEPRKIFSRPPQKSHLGKQKACKAMSNDSAGVEVRQLNSNSGSRRTT